MNNNTKLGAFCQAFVSIWAIESLAGIGAQNILGIVFLAAIYTFYRLEQDYSKEHKTLSLITSGVFGFLYTFYNHNDIKEQYDNRLFQVIVLLVVFMGMFFLFYHAVNAVFTWYLLGRAHEVIFICKECSNTSDEAMSERKGYKSIILVLKHIFTKRVFLCSFIICLIFWFPGYLYEYPGIITPDSINQIEQTLGLVPLSNHHPIAHTLLIGLCLKPVYAVTGNINIAIGFYTLVQMILMALIVAYSINTLRLIGLRLRWVYLALLFYTIIPFQWVYMVTMWKDVLFAGFVMLFAASFIRVVGSSAPRCDLIIHFIACVGTALYRNNGLYAFFLMIPFMCIWGLKALRKRKNMLITWGLALITIIVIRYPVMSGCGVVQPDFVESLSIPIQLFCRVLVEDKDLGAEDTQMVDKIIDTTYIHELYAYDFADNMKELFKAGHPDYLQEHIWEYAGLWIRTGLKYPGLYIDEYKNMTYGYWYPDNPKGEDYYVVAENDGVCDNALGIQRKWLIYGLPANLWLKTREIGIKLSDMLPGYGILYCMGSTFFLLCMSIGIILSGKKRGMVMPLLLVFFGVCTVLIATPVAADFRYSYFMTMMIPFIITIPAFNLEKK
ncbi:hypothetical protein SAMN04487884_10766 [Butyrivibrio fibrisolvens]|uniref:Uncharacterized protein n=1 Tax=Butyrivibrio fibrisolvens TaxID=831 RepID=A0A1H9Q7T0_BUTFI|nr:DUF6020 family protein [Butyrivibrio fibrisolvens]SER56616.1 hypothetical protein SAMN04487884_10766 [Butyrivibrio fibrisolvens]